MHVVRNGLALSRFSPQLYPRNACLLAVGNLYARKRWDRLIKIVSILSSKRQNSKFVMLEMAHCVVELEALARQLGVNHLVHFGSLSHRQLLADSNCLVHTADDEGCPNVVMEAMACRPSSVGGMDVGVISLCWSKMNGFVVPKRNMRKTFAHRVFQLLSDDDLCMRMGFLLLA